MSECAPVPSARSSVTTRSHGAGRFSMVVQMEEGRAEKVDSL